MGDSVDVFPKKGNTVIEFDIDNSKAADVIEMKISHSYFLITLPVAQDSSSLRVRIDKSEI